MNAERTEPLLYSPRTRGAGSPENTWIRWGRKWLILGVALHILGFLVADLIFLWQMAHSRLAVIPSTVSEAMALTYESGYQERLLSHHFCIFGDFTPERKTNSP